jgi:hypothetical protein
MTSSVKVTEGLKGMLGVRRNEEILPAVEGLMAQVEALKGRREPRPPIGMLVLMDEEEGPYWAVPVGLAGGDLLGKLERVKEGGRRFVEGDLTGMIEQVRAERLERLVRARVEKENADGENERIKRA